MKTKVFNPTFFLVNKDMVIRINNLTVVGRHEGHIILEDDSQLSNTHCELKPVVMDLYIKDLNSTNGVYVNKSKIFPDTDVKLHVGDKVKIGSLEYIVFDDERRVKQIIPPMDRRKNPRPKNLYGLENLYNFYCAPNFFRALYLLVIVGALASFVLNLQLEVPVPEKLNFLSKFYSEQIILAGIKIVFLSWFISFFHSFLLTVYFNRNPFRKLISSFLYAGALFVSIDFTQGPLGGVRRYIVEREAIENFKPTEDGIKHLKKLTGHKDGLTIGYKFTLKKLLDEERILLDSDYRNMISKVDKDIRKIKLTQISKN